MMNDNIAERLRGTVHTACLSDPAPCLICAVVLRAADTIETLVAEKADAQATVRGDKWYTDSLPIDLGDGTSIRRVKVALDYAPFGDTFYVEATND